MRNFVDANASSRFSNEKMKKNNLFTTERMFCDVYCLEPGQSQKAHAHADSDKVYYVLEGSGRISIGDEEREVGPGTAILAPAALAHGVANEGPGRLRVLVFMAPPP
jgi:mannose-6-phosphate isomerase-like protein (cupin superfamily)